MINKEFKDAITNENYTDVRNTIKNRLLFNHNVTSGMFNEYWTECKRAGIVEKLFEPHDGRNLCKELNEDNFINLVGQLSTNFSKERLDCILFIAKKLWPNDQVKNNSSHSQRTVNKQMLDSSSKNLMENGKKTGKSNIQIETEHASRRELQQTSNRRNLGNHTEKTGKNPKRSGYLNNRTKSNAAKIVIIVAIIIIVITGLGIFFTSGRN